MAIRVDAVLGADVGNYVSGMARASQASQQFANAANAGVNATTAGFGQLTASVKGIETSLNRFKSTAIRAFAAVGAAQVIPSIFNAAKTALIDFNQQLDQSRIAFTTFMGSADKANKMLEQLQIFAAKTPFNFKDLLSTTQQMIAMGTAAEDLIPRLTAIGDAAAALGGSPEVMRRIQRALGQIQAKGRVQAEELLQLAEVGIPAYEYIAKTLGVTIPQALKMMETGQVGAAQAITGLLDGMGESFGGMMQKHSQTMMGALSTVQDMVSITVANMSRPLFEAVRGMMVSVANLLSSENVKQGAADFANSVRDAFVSAGQVAIQIWDQVRPTLQSVYDLVINTGRLLANGWKAGQPILAGVVASIITIGKTIKPVIDGLGSLAKKLKDSKVAGMAVATAFITKFTPLGGMIKKIGEELTKLTMTKNTGEVFKVFGEGQKALASGTAQTTAGFVSMRQAYKNAMADIGQTSQQGFAVAAGAAKTMGEAAVRANAQLQEIPQQLTRMQAAGLALKTGFSNSMTAMATTFKTVMLSMKAALISFAAAIPLMAAIHFITVAVGKMGKEMRDAKQKTKELSDAIKGQITAIFESKEAFEEFSKSGITALTLMKNAISESGGDAATKIADSLAVLGLAVDNVDLVGLAGDFRNTAQSMLENVGISKDLASAMAGYIDANDDASLSHVTVNGELVTLTEAQKEYAKALEEVQDQLENDVLLNAIKNQEKALIATQRLSAADVQHAKELAARTEGFSTMNEVAQQAIILQEMLTLATSNYNDQLARTEYTQSRIAGYQADQIATAATEDLVQAYELLKQSQTDGQLTFEEFNQAIFKAADATGSWVRALRGAKGEVASITEGLQNGANSAEDLDEAGYALDQQLRQIFFTGQELHKTVPEINQAMQSLVATFVAGAKEGKITDDAINRLVNGLASLRQFGSVGINLYTNVDQVMEELSMVAEAMARLASVAGGGDAASQLFGRIQELLRIAEELKQKAPSRGGRGGGGSREDPMQGLASYVKDIENWLAQFFERDFAKNLIEKSGEDIGNAINDLLAEGFKLGLDKLPGAAGILSLIGDKLTQLIGNADQLRGIDGLEERLSSLNSEISTLEGNIASVRDRFIEFQRVEQGVGDPTTQQRLEDQLSVLGQMKTALSSLQSEYERFKTGGKTAMSEQLDILSALQSGLNSLQSEWSRIVNDFDSPTELEAQTQALRNLASEFENLKNARADYAKSTAESLQAFEIGSRGGALSTARRYLARLEAFRDVVTGLRDRAFPTQMIRDVMAAGIDTGTMIGRKLLSLSGADLEEFRQVQQQIAAVAAQTGEIAADVLFTADVNAAEQAFNRQMSVVENLYQKALAQAQAEFAAQQQIVDAMYQAQIAEAEAALELQKEVVAGLFKETLREMRAELDDMTRRRDVLITAIDDLKGTMGDLITQIGDLVTALTKGGGGGKNVGGGWSWEDTPGGGAIVTDPGGNEHYIPPGTDLSGRAMGGFVSAYKPYIVGEMGPELFMPSGSGNIIPNDVLVGAGGQKNYTINVNVAGGADIGRQVVKAIQDYERRNGTGWRA